MSTAAANRRNGKAASCEPCRKAKIRCDHQRPVCARCQHRGLAARCYYHPAPLTKPRAHPDHDASPAFVSSTLRTTPHTFDAGPRNLRTDGRSQITSNPSYASATPVPWPLTTKEYHARRPQLPLHQASSDEFYEQRFKTARGILACLEDVDLIQSLVRQYCFHAQAALVPSGFALAFSDSIGDITRHYISGDALGREDELSRFADRIIHNTSNAITVTPDVDPPQLLAMYTGENLRLEIIGLVFALAARAYLLGLTYDDNKREDFLQAMYNGAYSCLRLSRRIAADSNDGMLWLAFEYCRLTTHIEGDSSPKVYRLIGDIATYLFEFGVHRESFITSQTPFFLAETRRRLFFAAYHLDKFVATLIDRPPRILRRYSDCKMPLDLTDDELLACASEEQAGLRLTSEGWNIDAKYSPSTWQRMRGIVGSWREEILEYQFRPTNPENDMKLRELSRQCQQSMDSLPSHLRFSPDCWDSGLPPTVCLMLIVVHLNYLQSDFQIHRLLVKFDPEAWETMLNVATEAVALVLHLGTCLNRAIFLRHDFPYIVLGYGLPCAVVLTKTLQDIARGGNSPDLPASVNRSALIRKLSVFVSHLETICSPGDGDYHMCVQASKLISRALDEVLDSRTPASSAVAATSAHGPVTPASATNNAENVPVIGPSPSDQSFTIGGGVLPDLDILEGGDMDGMDLSTWIKNIDWTATGGEWSAF